MSFRKLPPPGLQRYEPGFQLLLAPGLLPLLAGGTPGIYGKACQTDADCYYKGINYWAACWDNGNGKPGCSGRGFIKNTSCDPSVCTFQYGHLGSKAWQPPYAQCTGVASENDKCIGDDTVHQGHAKG